MIDNIRKDLEPIIQQTLSKRPEFHVVSIEPIPEGHSGFTYFVDVKDNCQSLTRFCRCEALLQELNSDIGLMFQLRPIAARLHARIILL